MGFERSGVLEAMVLAGLAALAVGGCAALVGLDDGYYVPAPGGGGSGAGSGIGGDGTTGAGREASSGSGGAGPGASSGSGGGGSTAETHGSSGSSTATTTGGGEGGAGGEGGYWLGEECADEDVVPCSTCCDETHPRAATLYINELRSVCGCGIYAPCIEECESEDPTSDVCDGVLDPEDTINDLCDLCVGSIDSSFECYEPALVNWRNACGEHPECDSYERCQRLCSSQ